MSNTEQQGIKLQACCGHHHAAGTGPCRTVRVHGAPSSRGRARPDGTYDHGGRTISPCLCTGNNEGPGHATQ